jgi:hypothetical protein
MVKAYVPAITFSKEHIVDAITQLQARTVVASIF